MSSTSIWTALGIEPTREALEIRRAYARALKRANPEEDPAAFANLRSAYEQALRQAQSPATAEAPKPTPPQPAATEAAQNAPTPAPAAPSKGQQALAALNADMARLEASLSAAAAPEAETLRAQLAACLSSPILENVSALFAFERWLLGRLWQQRARAEPVLEFAIERMKWRDSHTGSPAAPLVAYADTVRRLRTLGEQHPRALSALTRLPRPARLWAEILLFRIDLQLCEELPALERAGAMLPERIDRAALTWWRQYFSRGQASALLIRTAAILLPLGALLGAIAVSPQSPPQPSAVGALIGTVLGGAMVAVGWLIAELRDQWKPKVVSLWQRLGWAAAGLVLCIGSALVGDSIVAAIVASLLALGVVAWAAVASPKMLTLKQAWGLLVLNIPVLVWLRAMQVNSNEAPTSALWVGVVALLIAFAVGVARLAVEFKYTLTPRLQRAMRLGLAAVSLLLAMDLCFFAVAPPGSGLVVTAVVSLILLQRLPVDLRDKQLKVRLWVSLAFGFLVFGPLLANGASPLRVGGAALLSGIVATMLTSEWNEWSERRQTGPSRGARWAPLR